MAIGSIIYAVYTAGIADTLLTREFNAAMNKVGSWGIASVVVLIIGKIMAVIGKNDKDNKNSRPMKERQQKLEQRKITSWFAGGSGSRKKEEESKRKADEDAEQQQKSFFAVLQ